MLAVFEAGVLRRGASWFVENLGWTRREVLAREEGALTRLLPRMDEVVGGLRVGAFAERAPVVTEEGWGEFMGRLPRFGGGGGEE